MSFFSVKEILPTNVESFFRAVRFCEKVKQAAASGVPETDRSKTILYQDFPRAYKDFYDSWKEKRPLVEPSGPETLKNLIAENKWSSLSALKRWEHLIQFCKTVEEANQTHFRSIDPTTQGLVAFNVYLGESVTYTEDDLRAVLRDLKETQPHILGIVAGSAFIPAAEDLINVLQTLPSSLRQQLQMELSSVSAKEAAIAEKEQAMTKEKREAKDRLWKGIEKLKELRAKITVKPCEFTLPEKDGEIDYSNPTSYSFFKIYFVRKDVLESPVNFYTQLELSSRLTLDSLKKLFKDQLLSKLGNDRRITYRQIFPFADEKTTRELVKEKEDTLLLGEEETLIPIFQTLTDLGSARYRFVQKIIRAYCEDPRKTDKKDKLLAVWRYVVTDHQKLYIFALHQFTETISGKKEVKILKKAVFEKVASSSSDPYLLLLFFLQMYFEFVLPAVQLYYEKQYEIFDVMRFPCFRDVLIAAMRSSLVDVMAKNMNSEYDYDSGTIKNPFKFPALSSIVQYADFVPLPEEFQSKAKILSDLGLNPWSFVSSENRENIRETKNLLSIIYKSWDPTTAEKVKRLQPLFIYFSLRDRRGKLMGEQISDLRTRIQQMKETIEMIEKDESLTVEEKTRGIEDLATKIAEMQGREIRWSSSLGEMTQDVHSISAVLEYDKIVESTDQLFATKSDRDRRTYAEMKNRWEQLAYWLHRVEVEENLTYDADLYIQSMIDELSLRIDALFSALPSGAEDASMNDLLLELRRNTEDAIQKWKAFYQAEADLRDIVFQ